MGVCAGCGPVYGGTPQSHTQRAEEDQGSIFPTEFLGINQSQGLHELQIDLATRQQNKAP